MKKCSLKGGTDQIKNNKKSTMIYSMAILSIKIKVFLTLYVLDLETLTLQIELMFEFNNDIFK